MKKLILFLLVAAFVSANAIEDLRVNGGRRFASMDNTQPVFISFRVDSPDEELWISVWEDANWNGRPNAGEYMMKKWMVRPDIGPMDDGRNFPGNIHASTVRMSKASSDEMPGYYDVLIPIYPYGCDYTGSGSFAIQVQSGGPGSPADHVQVTYSPPDANVWGNMLDTTAPEPSGGEHDSSVRGLSIYMKTTDSATGKTTGYSAISDTYGEFRCKVPPGDYKLNAYPFINSKVKPLWDYPVTVPETGTWMDDVIVDGNDFSIEGKADARLADSHTVTAYYRGTDTNYPSSTSLIQPDGSYEIGVPAPGPYNVRIGSSQKFPSQNVVPMFTDFDVTVTPATMSTPWTIPALENDAGIVGNIEILYDGVPPNDSFGNFDINGYLHIHAWGMDKQTMRQLEYSRFCDTTAPSGGVFAGGAPKMAKSASSPYLSGNFYRMRVRSSNLTMSAFAPFGFVKSINSNVDIAEGEIAEGPTLIWEFGPDDVLTIEGIVRDPDGNPVEGAVVAARTTTSYSDRSRRGYAVTDSAGKYSIRYLKKFDIPGGDWDWTNDHTYHVGVFMPGGYKAEPQQVLGQTSGVHTVNFDMTLPAGVDESSSYPTEYALGNNYPNPFNPVTNIPYTVASVGQVSIRIFDIQGRQITTLIQKNHVPGKYKVQWDASGQASGLYFIRMQTPDRYITRKCTLLK